MERHTKSEAASHNEIKSEEVEIALGDIPDHHYASNNHDGLMEERQIFIKQESVSIKLEDIDSSYGGDQSSDGLMAKIATVEGIRRAAHWLRHL